MWIQFPFQIPFLIVIKYPDPKTPVPSNSNMDSGSRKRAKIGRNSDTASSPRRTSAYSPALEQHLIDHGVYPHRYYNGSDDDDGSVYPENWEEINERLVQPRRSLSPSRFTREEFRKFEKTNMQALTEDQVMSKVFPIITGTAHILSQGNLYFGNLKHLTDGSITKSKPDFYDGACPAELNKQVRQKLSKSIEPSIKKTAPLLPNFFTEGKGPDGSASVCRLQAMYDGALGARGIHELRLYVDPETAYDNNAYTITSTYHGGTGTLAMYTTHPTLSKSPIKSTEYRMTQLKAFAVTSDPDTFRRGVSALRNARDWAKEQRRKLMAAANSKVPDAEGSDMASFAQSFVSRASEPTLAESETSADELALDPGMVGK